MTAPAVSIVMPFHNAAATLAEALDSIAGQTFTDFELLAIDDGSNDGSTALVERYAERDGRIRLLRPGRVGFVAAVNLGLEAGRAEWVARMDADDRMHPDRLERQWAALAADPSLALVGTRVRLFPEEAIQAGMQEYVRWQNACTDPATIAAEIYVESPVAHPTMLYHRETVRGLGGYRDGVLPEDYDLLLRLHAAGYRMGKVPEVLLEWRDGPDRLSRTDPRCSREAFDRLRAEYLAADPRLAADRPLVFWGAGRKTRRRAEWLQAHGHRPAAWVDIDPRKIGNRIGGAPVVAPEWLDRPERPFVLSWVNRHGAAARIGGYLEGIGYRPGADYLRVG
ncbi:MAG TPA: glycosyltransferase [Gammaproteobacteria bacterium]|nr:glycosyltransferase [Gammaproteobacteria bacterium]